MEGSPFLRMETREELLIVVIGNLRQFRNNAAPRTSQREQLTSIVYGVSPAPDPALRLEFVDDLGDRATLGRFQSFFVVAAKAMRICRRHCGCAND